MKHWLTAAALTPVLIACASAGAAETADAGEQVLIVNGERIEIRPGADAAAAIEAALDWRGDRRVHVEVAFEDAELRTGAEREVFAEAVAALGSGLIEDAMIVAFGSGDLAFEFSGDLDEAALQRQADHADHHAERLERHAERLERHAERMARQAERLAARAERNGRRAASFGRRMEIHGLEAGVRGMESGLAGIEEGLERGWIYDGGERRAMTESDRRELEEARAELARELEEMRARLAEAREGGNRDVRIQRRNGEVRAWVNGEEVAGSALDRLLREEEGRLAGAPVPPPAPQPD